MWASADATSTSTWWRLSGGEGFDTARPANTRGASDRVGAVAVIQKRGQGALASPQARGRGLRRPAQAHLHDARHVHPERAALEGAVEQARAPHGVSQRAAAGRKGGGALGQPCRESLLRCKQRQGTGARAAAPCARQTRRGPGPRTVLTGP